MRNFTGFGDLIGYWNERDPEGTAFIMSSDDSEDSKVLISYKELRRVLFAGAGNFIPGELKTRLNVK